MAKRDSTQLSEPIDGDQASTSVVVCSIDDVLIDQSNVREHDDRNISTIVGSLKQFGSGRSIVLDADNIVRAGNGTVQAARQAGFKEILVVEPRPDQLMAVRRSDWTPVEATGYSIVDNRSTDLSRYDLSGLTVKLEALKQSGLDGTKLGWSNEEMLILKDSVSHLLDHNAVPEQTPGPEQDETKIDKANSNFVRFKFGDYSGPVSKDVYESFVSTYKEKQQESSEPIMDDVLRFWLGL
jgi:hypothetical protein